LDCVYYNRFIGTNAKLRRLLLFAVIAPCALSAQVSKTLDLSTTRGLKNFYVVFASRDGSATGHAFIVWGVEDGVRRKSSIRALGLYPEGEGTNCSSVVRTVPGRVMDELINHSVQGITEQLIVRVDEADFNRSWKVGRAWDCKHEFSLLSKDCVEFLRAVGGSLRLNMPSRFLTRWTPRAYVRAVLASAVEDGTLELETALYQGSLMDKRPMGQGTLAFDDGSRVEGTFRGFDRHTGSGRLNGLPNGYFYEGEIVDYQAQGKGTISRTSINDGEESTIKVLAGVFTAGSLQKVTHTYRANETTATIQASVAAPKPR